MSNNVTDNATILLLTKIAPLFVYPLGLTFVCSIAGVVVATLGQKVLAVVLLGLGWGWLWIAATPLFAEWATASLERQYPPEPIDKTPKADVAIVLGGGVGQPAPPRVEADLNNAFDRVFQAIRLYHAGRVEHVLVTGGNVPWRPDIVPEAELIRSFLVDWGKVPAEAIEIGTASRNTYENALEISRLWKSRPFSSALLITSATHMPRAMAVFRKAGIPVTASTTDIQALNNIPRTPLRWMPQASALDMTTIAIKEWLGYLGYRIRGYV